MKAAFERDFLNHHHPPSQEQREQDQPPQKYPAKDLWFKTHLFVPWVNRIVRHPHLVSAVQTILQSPDLRVWSCDFNVRPEGAPEMVAPHQDATFAGLDPPNKVVTAWVALSDPVTERHGGLLFAPGSHQCGPLPHTIDAPDDDDGSAGALRNVLSRRQRCASELCTRSIPLRAGQATLHSFYTVHASGPNPAIGAGPRIGLAIRYMTAAVRKCHAVVPERITWISGSRAIGPDGWDAEWEPILPEDPTSEEVQQGRTAHRDAMSRETTNYFAAPRPKR